MVVAGIDEAGYGPMLGPLVVAQTAFRVDKDREDGNFWPHLDKAVTQRVMRREPRLIVADSKAVYGGVRSADRLSAAGLERLERTVLAFCAQSSPRPKTLAGLLNRMGVERISPCPWYGDTGQAIVDLSLPVRAEPDDVALSAKMLGRALSRARISSAAIDGSVLTAGQFNDMVGRTRNKSAVLFWMTGVCIARLIRRFGREGIVIYVDRQGGRKSYRKQLQTAFARMNLKVVREASDASVYRLDGSDGFLTVTFRTKGETHYFPVALASMTAKYLRELFMLLFNRYWSEVAPEVAPTAGYVTDARRWLGQMAPYLDRIARDRSQLIRQR